MNNKGVIESIAHDTNRCRGWCFAIVCDTVKECRTDWSKITAASKAATVQCAGSSAHDQLANSVAPTTSCVTFSVPAREPIGKSPPTAAGSTSFAALRRF
jgi:hypothetical protein